MINGNFDATEVVGQALLKEHLKDMEKINWHSVRTIGLLGITFVVAGLQALHGLTGFDAKVDMVLPLLLLAEHALAGNSWTSE